MRYSEEPLVTVIIPVYNARETVTGAVWSALRQTWKNLEILLIDDGSSDGSGVICDRLAGLHSQIRVLHTENRGVSHARNAALEIAGGELVTFLDADDRLHPQMIERLVALLRDKEAWIAGCGFRTVTEQKAHETGSSQEVQESFAEHRGSGGEAAAPDAASTYPVHTYSGEAFVELGILASDTRVWSKLFDRSLIGDRRFSEKLTIGEDMLFLLSLLPECDKIAETEEPMYEYYANPRGAMEKPFAPSYMDQARCWERAEEFLQEKMPAVCENAAIRSRLAAIQCISVMLVASKISYLPKEEKKRYQAEVVSLRQKLLRYRQVKGCFGALPAGYKVKVWTFQHLPGLYLWTYGRLRKR
ncbi:MAG: glycosyltransferase family A protein [Eubacteriales bacterium]|nr:glycosyltransferase family A protein [Eubacteriales bacterium]